jgi:hypothetical protein
MREKIAFAKSPEHLNIISTTYIFHQSFSSFGRMVMKMKVLIAMVVACLFFAQFFSGCIGGYDSNEAIKSSGNEKINLETSETENNSIENKFSGNETIYIEQANGTLRADVDGLLSIMAEALGIMHGCYYFTLPRAPSKLELILNYTAEMGDLVITLYNSDNNIIGESEGDGSGTETIVIKGRNVPTGQLTLYLRGGAMNYAAPTLMANYTLTVKSYSEPIENFYESNPTGFPPI